MGLGVLGKLFLLCKVVDGFFMEIGGEDFAFKQSIHKVNYDAVLVVFLDSALEILILKELDQQKFHLQNDQNLSIFSQYDIVDDFYPIDLNADAVEAYLIEVLLEYFGFGCLW